MRRSTPKTLTIALALLLMISFGCATSGGGESASGAGGISGTTTVDGLVLVESDAPGQLFLRENHGIGGYDAIAVAPSFVSYRRTSGRLDPDDEMVYLVSLEQAILDVAEAAQVSIVNSLGNCVIKIGAGFINVDLAQSDTAETLGRMTLVIEYQDSVSGQSLLRYAAEQYVQRESGGKSREQQVRDSFDRMIGEVDIVTALRQATAVPSPPKEGCNGSLIEARSTAATE